MMGPRVVNGGHYEIDQNKRNCSGTRLYAKSKLEGYLMIEEVQCVAAKNIPRTGVHVQRATVPVQLVILQQ
jgi:hypothetical protein